MKLSNPLKTVVVVAGMAFATSAFTGSEYGVSINPSDLGSAQGVSDVHSRIVAEARAYCPNYREAGSLRNVRACIKDVTDDLVSKIDNPMLTSYHHGDTGVAIARNTSDMDADRS